MTSETLQDLVIDAVSTAFTAAEIQNALTTAHQTCEAEAERTITLVGVDMSDYVVSNDQDANVITGLAIKILNQTNQIFRGNRENIDILSPAELMTDEMRQMLIKSSDDTDITRMWSSDPPTEDYVI